jgi:gas vesicle protein
MENNNKSGGNFLSGFLIGIIIGAGVVFLLATKRGKKILKAISEEGSENISNILDKIDKSVDMSDESLEESSGEITEDKGSVIREENIINEDKPKIRRFFRGISKRAN